MAEETKPFEEKASITVKKHIGERRPKLKRKNLYANLPIREVKIPLTEDQRRCKYCNSEMGTMTYTSAAGTKFNMTKQSLQTVYGHLVRGRGSNAI